MVYQHKNVMQFAIAILLLAVGFIYGYFTAQSHQLANACQDHTSIPKAQHQLQTESIPYTYPPSLALPPTHSQEFITPPPPDTRSEKTQQLHGRRSELIPPHPTFTFPIPLSMMKAPIYGADRISNDAINRTLVFDIIWKENQLIIISHTYLDIPFNFFKEVRVEIHLSSRGSNVANAQWILVDQMALETKYLGLQSYVYLLKPASVDDSTALLPELEGETSLHVRVTYLPLDISQTWTVEKMKNWDDRAEARKNIAIATLFLVKDAFLIPISYAYYRAQGVRYFYYYFNGPQAEFDALLPSLPQDLEGVFYGVWDHIYFMPRAENTKHHHQVAQTTFIDMAVQRLLARHEFLLLIDLDEFIAIVNPTFDQSKTPPSRKLNRSATLADYAYEQRELNPFRTVWLAHNVWSLFTPSTQRRVALAHPTSIFAQREGIAPDSAPAAESIDSLDIVYHSVPLKEDLTKGVGQRPKPLYHRSFSGYPDIHRPRNRGRIKSLNLSEYQEGKQGGPDFNLRMFHIFDITKPARINQIKGQVNLTQPEGALTLLLA